MPDNGIRRLFDQLVAEPSAEFEASLRRRLLDELAAPGASPGDHPPLPWEDDIMTATLQQASDSAGRKRHRQLAVWAAVGLAAAAIAIGVVLATRDSDGSPPVATTLVSQTTVATPTTATPTTAVVPTSSATPTSAVSPTVATPTTAATATASTLPLVTIEPGTYVVPTFAVPLEFTTTDQWRRLFSRQEVVGLGRGTNGDTSVLVTSGLISGSTPEEATSKLCPVGRVELGTPASTTLLGRPAVQVEGRPTELTCQFAALDTVMQLEIPVGHTFRIVAADVDGTMVVVVVFAPTDQWAGLAPEIDALVASMRLAS